MSLHVTGCWSPLGPGHSATGSARAGAGAPLHRGLQPPSAPGHCNKAAHWSSQQPLGPGGPMGGLEAACVPGPGIDPPWCGWWVSVPGSVLLSRPPWRQTTRCLMLPNTRCQLQPALDTAPVQAQDPVSVLTLGLFAQKSTVYCTVSILHIF